jgi:hypothetical protein
MRPGHLFDALDVAFPRLSPRLFDGASRLHVPVAGQPAGLAGKTPLQAMK